MKTRDLIAGIVYIASDGDKDLGYRIVIRIEKEAIKGYYYRKYYQIVHRSECH